MSDQSYGLYVARMAGIPEQIIQKCEEYLKGKQDDKEKRVCNIVMKLNVDKLTPLQCMLCIMEMKKILQMQKKEEEKKALEQLVEHYCK